MIKHIELCRDYDVLTNIWTASVMATHDFISENDIEFYRQKIPHDYMPNIELYAVRNSNGELCAFIGLNKDIIEMLFVHPDDMGKGYGSLLLQFAKESKGIRKVDVNEQNHPAVRFYMRHGFSIIGRDAFDGEGKPYPILHLGL
ncbi:GNAT family N-acetyltransferase [Xylanibacter muris]|uniref:GNAT family N-acetyltransferase n=1 Tax=Xylanibacter muris TaxID=2736290 RepID=A0ABX2AL78_9BACT|nr:GNAT family N-acetyltransferase [Xylanibacter muris]NPD91954.1 GNAT family N-acetyltransferase [Xylanibacter muris]